VIAKTTTQIPKKIDQRPILPLPYQPKQSKPTMDKINDVVEFSMIRFYSNSDNNALQLTVNKICLDGAKNSVRIEELRIVHENSEKIVIFQLARG
jgi:hypothetical protein